MGESDGNYTCNISQWPKNHLTFSSVARFDHADITSHQGAKYACDQVDPVVNALICS